MSNLLIRILPHPGVAVGQMKRCGGSSTKVDLENGKVFTLTREWWGRPENDSVTEYRNEGRNIERASSLRKRNLFTLIQYKYNYFFLVSHMVFLVHLREFVSQYRACWQSQ